MELLVVHFDVDVPRIANRRLQPVVRLQPGVILVSLQVDRKGVDGTGLAVVYLCHKILLKHGYLGYYGSFLLGPERYFFFLVFLIFLVFIFVTEEQLVRVEGARAVRGLPRVVFAVNAFTPNAMLALLGFIRNWPDHFL